MNSRGILDNTHTNVTHEEVIALRVVHLHVRISSFLYSQKDVEDTDWENFQEIDTLRACSWYVMGLFTLLGQGPKRACICCVSMLSYLHRRYAYARCLQRFPQAFHPRPMRPSLRSTPFTLCRACPRTLRPDC